jgi:hypothetical protein
MTTPAAQGAGRPAGVPLLAEQLMLLAFSPRDWRLRMGVGSYLPTGLVTTSRGRFRQRGGAAAAPLAPLRQQAESWVD